MLYTKTYDYLTKQALINFQIEKGLSPDEEVNSNTWKNLYLPWDNVTNEPDRSSNNYIILNNSNLNIPRSNFIMTDTYINNQEVESLISLIDAQKKIYYEEENLRLICKASQKSTNQLNAEGNILNLRNRLIHLEAGNTTETMYLSEDAEGYAGSWEWYKLCRTERIVNEKVDNIKMLQQNEAGLIWSLEHLPWEHPIDPTYETIPKVTMEELNKLYKLKAMVSYAINIGRNVFEDEISISEDTYKITTNWGTVFDSREFTLKQLNGEYWAYSCTRLGEYGNGVKYHFDLEQASTYLNIRQERYNTTGFEKLPEFLNQIGPLYELEPYSKSLEDRIEDGMTALVLAGTIIIAAEAIPAVMALGSAEVAYLSNKWSILTSNMGTSSYQYLTNAGVVSGLFEEAIPIITEVDYVAAIAATNQLSSLILMADKFPAIAHATLGNSGGHTGSGHPYDIYNRTPQELEDLTKDPDHGFKPSPKSIAERDAALKVEARGEIRGPIRRDPNRASGDFIDADEIKWDVKGWFSERPEGYNLNKAIEKIEETIFEKKENVIIDTSLMKQEHIQELYQEIAKKCWGDYIRWDVIPF